MTSRCLIYQRMHSKHFVILTLSVKIQLHVGTKIGVRIENYRFFQMQFRKHRRDQFSRKHRLEIEL